MIQEALDARINPTFHYFLMMAFFIAYFYTSYAGHIVFNNLCTKKPIRNWIITQFTLCLILSSTVTIYQNKYFELDKMTIDFLKYLAILSAISPIQMLVGWFGISRFVYGSTHIYKQLINFRQN